MKLREALVWPFNKTLGRIPLFRDCVLAISNLTRNLNELIKAYTQLAKMVIEDREAINDLYQLHAELQDEKLRTFGNSLQKTQPQQQPQQTRQDPSRINTEWSESDKKKVSN